jgi:hypothetical protein
MIRTFTMLAITMLSPALAIAQPTPRPATTVAECVELGVAYYKEIGSWPRLTAPPNRGRDARQVAAERCNRTVGAFNPPPR